MTLNTAKPDKSELRRQMRRIRDAIPAAGRLAAARAVAAAGLDFLDPPAGAVVAGYWPVNSEFDCLPLLERIFRDGYTIALPVILPDTRLEFAAWTPGAPMQCGPNGIPQPAAPDIVEPGIFIVPLLAFDAAFHRLGYGAGYYDRALRAMRRTREITAVGLAFDEQGLSHLPANEYDEQLDWLLTPSGARKRES